MSSYYPSFIYNGVNSKDFGLVVSHFDGGDSGEVESFLSMDPIYTDNYLGTRRIDYGAKYNSVAVFSITVIKQSGGDFSVQEIRNCLKQFTGAHSNSNLDLLVNDEIKYSFTGRFTNASHYKMDARTIGLVLEFTSISPWAYSPKQTKSYSIDGSKTITIKCDSDDLYTSVYMNAIYKNTAGSSLTITNNTLNNETTEINNIGINEIVTLDSNMVITSSNKAKVFGNNFNYIFPRLKSGDNTLVVNGTGNITFEYIYPIKLGNVAIDINMVSDPICDPEGNIQLDTLPWSRISNTPTTLSGYGITNAYTKTEVDRLIRNIDMSDIDVYTKSEIDAKFSNLDAADVNTYSKAEIDNKLSDITIDSISWNDIADKPNTAAGYGIEDVYTADKVYTKTEVDERLKNLSPGVDVPTDTLSWYKITDTPTSVSGYGIQDTYTKDEVYTKTEVNEMISSVEVVIDEIELDAMLAEVLA